MSTGTGPAAAPAFAEAAFPFPARARTAGMSNGWRAAGSSMRESGARAGSTPSTSRENRARAWMTSSSAAADTVRRRSSPRRRSPFARASRMRRISFASSCSRATMSLLISTVLSGSRKRLAPLPELPCTMPGIDPRCSERTRSTKRPSRSVTTCSCR